MLGAATDRTGAPARRAAASGSRAATTRIARTFEPPFIGVLRRPTVTHPSSAHAPRVSPRNPSTGCAGASGVRRRKRGASAQGAWERLRVPSGFYAEVVGEPNVWSVACLPAPESDAADLIVNGFELSCAVPDGTGAEPPGATPFGLLAASLSACTAMSVRTFLQRWHVDPGAVTVRVGVHPSNPPMLDRRVTVDGEVGQDLREQLAAVVDSTPVTVLLRDAVTIRTVLATGQDEVAR